MELKYLTTVKTILETGSFQNAARKLNYTQSTVTFQIQQLEQELHIKLFEKIGRKMVLTQAGKDLIPYIDSVLETINKISSYGKSSGELTGTLKIAMPESLMVYKMQTALGAFRREAPNVKIHLQLSNCYQICNSITSGEVDIGIHYNIGKNKSLTTETLRDFPFVLVASPNSPTKLHDFVTPNQEKEITLIYGDYDSIYYEHFHEYLKKKNISINGNLAIQSIEAIKQCVISNLGIAFLPRFTIENELKDHTLIEINTDMNNSTISSMVSYHKNKWISPAMELFIRLVKDNL